MPGAGIGPASPGYEPGVVPVDYPGHGYSIGCPRCRLEVNPGHRDFGVEGTHSCTGNSLNLLAADRMNSANARS